MTATCTGICDTCEVDHNELSQTTNRGHGISYSEKVKEYVRKGDYVNRNDKFDLILVENGKNIFKGEFGSPACGDIVNIWVKVDKDMDTIKDIRYLSTGCWGSISSSSYGCEILLGKKLSEINSIDLNNDIMNTLQLPQIKKHCSIFIGMCIDQIKEKIKDSLI